MNCLTLYIAPNIYRNNTTRRHMKELTWDNLIPKEKNAEGPVGKLTKFQLDSFILLYNLKKLTEQKSELSGAKTFSTMDRIKTVLENQGINVNLLLEYHEQSKATDIQVSEEGEKELDGKIVKIRGHLLPLEHSDKIATEFLLVPWIGAFVHTPAPLKNQIIYVKFDLGFRPKNQFETVCVYGRLLVRRKVSELHLLKGSHQVYSAYSLLTHKIKNA